MTLSVRIPRQSLDLLNRIVDGEREYLQKKGQPTKGVHKSTAFRTIWELGEVEYLLQRVTLWITRRNNRYTVEQAAQLLGWRPEVLRRMLKERGVDPGPMPAAPPPPPEGPPGTRGDAEVARPIDPKFLV